MKRLIALLFLLPLLAFADANDPVVFQRDQWDNSTFNYNVSQPPSNKSGLFFYDGTAKTVLVLPFGTAFSNVGGTLVSSPAFASITGLPATLAGYGITDGVTSSALSTALAAKFNVPSGTTAQYVRGDGTLATLPTAAALSINDSPGRSLVSSTTSTGYQISSTRIARACYEGSFSTTSTIGGAAAASVFLETADTNSTTASDWTTKATQTYSNTITLAVALNQVQGNNWSFCRDIPAGKYVRIRSGGITGTASVSLNTQQQETLY